MEFTKFKIVGYRAVEGTQSANNLLRQTQTALQKVFSSTASGASLTPEEKSQVKILTGNQEGFFNVIVIIPVQNEEVKRVSIALSQIWDPALRRAVYMDIFADLQPNRPHCKN